MDDRDWGRLKEPWERLRWARMRWQSNAGGFGSARAAAESLGMNEGTYAAYERGPEASKHIALDHQRAIQFAKKFQVNWVWLLTGDETPFGRSEAEDRVVKAMAAATPERQAMIVETVEALAARSGVG
jgi:hypothetical protein